MGLKQHIQETFDHLGNHGALPGDREALEAARQKRMLETGEHQAIKTEAMGALAVNGVLSPEHAHEARHITVVDQTAPPVEIPVHQG